MLHDRVSEQVALLEKPWAKEETLQAIGGGKKTTVHRQTPHKFCVAHSRKLNRAEIRPTHNTTILVH